MDKKGDIPRTLGFQERLLREVHKPCFAKDLMRRLCEKRNGFLALENRIFRPQPFTAGSKSTNAFNLKRNARERAQGTARCGILQSQPTEAILAIADRESSPCTEHMHKTERTRGPQAHRPFAGQREASRRPKFAGSRRRQSAGHARAFGSRTEIGGQGASQSRPFRCCADKQ